MPSRLDSLLVEDLDCDMQEQDHRRLWNTARLLQECPLSNYSHKTKQPSTSLVNLICVWYLEPKSQGMIEVMVDQSKAKNLPSSSTERALFQMQLFSLQQRMLKQAHLQRADAWWWQIGSSSPHWWPPTKTPWYGTWCCQQQQIPRQHATHSQLTWPPAKTETSSLWLLVMLCRNVVI